MKAFKHREFVAWIDACRGGDSIRKFARETGVSAATVVRIRAGKNPDIETFGKLAMLCGLDLVPKFFDRRALPT